jgi:hypothetical protein
MLLSTNPIAAAIPAGDEKPIILDMATTVAAYGKVKSKALRGETMPEGWMIDREGKPLTDPKRADEGMLLPLGGMEAGYKGYGLAMIIGLLAGTLGGAAMGRDVIDFNHDDDSVTNTGQAIAAINIAAFGDVAVFKASVDALVRDFRNSERMPGVAGLSRRDLLSLIGSVAGSAAMYHAMTSLGLRVGVQLQGPDQAERRSKRRIRAGPRRGSRRHDGRARVARGRLQGPGAGVQQPPGGRNWTLRGGDSFTELGGATQTCGFEQGLYLNPGPWRIPYHHRAVLDYCKRLGVALEPFIQLNHNALLHASNAFGGKPQRIRDIKADFQGHVSELLAKVTQQSKLDEAVSVEDRRFCCRRCGPGARSTKLCLQGQPDFGGLSRLRQGSRRRPRCRAGRRRADQPVGYPEIAALAIFAEFRLA